MPPRHKPVTRVHLRRGLLMRIKHILAIFAVVVMFSVGILVAWATILKIPAIDNFQNRKVAESTKIYDRTGNILLYDVHGTIDRKSTRLNSSHSSISYSAF